MPSIHWYVMLKKGHICRLLVACQPTPPYTHTTCLPAGKRLPWTPDPELWQRWRDGKTGLPLVDANMRELAATGGWDPAEGVNDWIGPASAPRWSQGKHLCSAVTA
jgi:hypothetical protein